MAVDQFSFKNLMNYSKFKKFFFPVQIADVWWDSFGWMPHDEHKGGGGAKTLF